MCTNLSSICYWRGTWDDGQRFHHLSGKWSTPQVYRVHPIIQLQWWRSILLDKVYPSLPLNRPQVNHSPNKMLTGCHFTALFFADSSQLSSYVRISCLSTLWLSLHGLISAVISREFYGVRAIFIARLLFLTSTWTVHSGARLSGPTRVDETMEEAAPKTHA